MLQPSASSSELHFLSKKEHKMLDYNKPMIVRGSKAPARFLAEVNRPGSGTYNHAFIQTNLDGTEDIIWRTGEGKHNDAMPEHDVINLPPPQEIRWVSLNTSDVMLGGGVGQIKDVSSYSRNFEPHTRMLRYNVLKLTYENGILITSEIVKG